MQKSKNFYDSLKIFIITFNAKYALNYQSINLTKTNVNKQIKISN